MNLAHFPGNASEFERASISENGKQVLEARYLKKDDSGTVVESPDEMFWRVARTVAAADANYDGGNVEAASQVFFDMMHRLEFLPNSPTLMNAGRDLQQLSACFVLPVEDALDAIFETVKDMALIHKSGGGTGFSFSRIRPRGDRVRSTQGVASGPVSFMRVFDAATDAVKQGGARRGANMGVLRVDHPDILDFIDSKSSRTELQNFNISVAVDDAFMKAAAAGENYVLVHPRTGAPKGHLNARDVLRRISRRAWESGDPGLLFVDAINRANPTPSLGNMECTNPCGEQPLLPFEACNLGSINLARMTLLQNGRIVINYPHLARTVYAAVYFLDNVIDANEYPLPRIRAVTRGNRKIGLGVMGWADLLMKLGIPYGSTQALTVADRLMGFIRRTGHRASAELAIKRGPYPNSSAQEKSAGRNRTPMRNATVTTIAPTGSLSIIAGCSSGIEPVYALSFLRKNILGGVEIEEIHAGLLEELSNKGLGTADILEKISKTGSASAVRELPSEIRARYATAIEIEPEWHVRTQAAFQAHSDSAVSKTVNLPFNATVEDVEVIFRLSYELGCKGITVYRDRCRDSQVLNAGCTACA